MHGYRARSPCPSLFPLWNRSEPAVMLEEEFPAFRMRRDFFLRLPPQVPCSHQDFPSDL